MKADAEERAKEVDMAFEQSLFIHDRELWQAMFEPSEEQIEEEVEWVTREDPEEFREMMGELREMGLLAE